MIYLNSENLIIITPHQPKFKIDHYQEVVYPAFPNKEIAKKLLK